MCIRDRFCDTDPLATTIWADALLGHVPPEVTRLASARPYDLTLLCDVDVPFVPDPQRYQPEQADRDAFFADCQRALSDHGRRHVVLRGSWEERLSTATAAVDALLSTPR